MKAARSTQHAARSTLIVTTGEYIHVMGLEVVYNHRLHAEKRFVRNEGIGVQMQAQDRIKVAMAGYVLEIHKLTAKRD